MMKACGYCGRENDDSAAFCAECGTAFEENVPSEPRIPALPLAKRLHELNAWSATAILLTFLSVEVVCAILAAMVVVLSLQAQGTYSPDRFGSALRAAMAMPIMSVLILIFTLALYRQHAA
jgi:uncharacterized membrane protein YvbJ